MATVTDSNTASAASVTINRRKTPDKDCSACCATTLDIRCNSEGEFPLALPLSEVKAQIPDKITWGGSNETIDVGNQSFCCGFAYGLERKSRRQPRSSRLG